MKINNALKIFALNCLAGAMLSSSPVRANDEADKLKQLEHAMTAPSEKKLVNKPRTRAIVFDAAPDAAPNAAPNAAPDAAPKADAGQTQATPPMGNCGIPAADAKITAVDFAIQFKVGSAELTEPSEKTLLQIAKILALSNNCVLVEGHTDSAGNTSSNLELSRQRADSVVRFITGKEGIVQTRLVPIGKGSSEPVMNLDSRNPKNRRVVFKVVG